MSSSRYVDEVAAPTVLDYVTVAAMSGASVAMVWGSVVLLWHRAYRPIRAKNVPLTLVASAAGLLWILSTLVVNHHFPTRRHTGLDLCIFWTYWIQSCFGFSLWLNCLTVRLISLYRIFVWKSAVNHFHVYSLLLPLLLPSIAFAIAATLKHKSVIQFQTMPDDPNRGHCIFLSRRIWVYGLILLQFINYAVFVGLSVRLRNIMVQFNEFRMILMGGMLSLFLFLFTLVTLDTQAYNQAIGRCFLSTAVGCMVFYCFWATNGAVIYNVMFNPDKYLERFNAELRRQPSELERKQSFGSFLKMETQLNKVREEARRYDERLKELEDEVTALEVEEE